VADRACAHGWIDAMSVSLEALRKSESERQRGQLPGLMSPVIAVRRRRPYRRWIVLAFMLAVGLGGGWWLALKLSTPAVPAMPSRAAGQAAPAATGMTTSGTTDAYSVTDTTATRAQAATPDVTPPAWPRAGEAGLGSPPPPVAAPKALAVEAPAAQPVPPPQPAPVVSTAAPGVDSSAAPTTELAATPTASVANSVPLSQMPPAQRGALPPLKLSVHVFADEATRRFAIIDGRRHVEGDELAAGVRLREIQREGVLLDVGGQPWLLERPR